MYTTRIASAIIYSLTLAARDGANHYKSLKWAQQVLLASRSTYISTYTQAGLRLPEPTQTLRAGQSWPEF
jgi:hypothetical protein